MEIVESRTRVGHRRYDWDAWASDDRVKRFRKGEDYNCATKSFIHTASRIAQKRGWRMNYEMEGPDSVLMAWQTDE